MANPMTTATPAAMANEAPMPPAAAHSDSGRLHKRSRSGQLSSYYNQLIFSNVVTVVLSLLLMLSGSIGCFTCRLRRKKCDEGHPSCSACTNLCLKCEYKRPVWWTSTEQRKAQKERIKIRIKHTKMMERRGSLQGMQRVWRKSGGLLTFLATRLYGSNSCGTY